jgi:hypothetical protein
MKRITPDITFLIFSILSHNQIIKQRILEHFFLRSNVTVQTLHIGITNLGSRFCGEVFTLIDVTLDWTETKKGKKRT